MRLTRIGLWCLCKLAGQAFLVKPRLVTHRCLHHYVQYLYQVRARERVPVTGTVWWYTVRHRTIFFYSNPRELQYLVPCSRARPRPTRKQKCQRKKTGWPQLAGLPSSLFGSNSSRFLLVLFTYNSIEKKIVCYFKSNGRFLLSEYDQRERET